MQQKVCTALAVPLLAINLAQEDFDVGHQLLPVGPENQVAVGEPVPDNSQSHDGRFLAGTAYRRMPGWRGGRGANSSCQGQP